MSRSFKMHSRDPRDSGHKVYKRTQFTINPGLTILTGCNGAGKSTLIFMMKEQLNEEDILFTSYNNLENGGYLAKDLALNDGNIGLLASLSFSSEGESINANLGGIISRVVKYIETDNPKDLLARDERFHLIFSNKQFAPNEVWIFLDGVDSGMSINAVIDLKSVLHKMIEGLQSKGKEVYIIVSANEYELCDKENCFDVQGLRYTQYKTYNSYKRAIMRSAEYKYREIDRANERESKKKRGNS